MATRKVTIQNVEHIELRITVEVSWEAKTEQWLVRYLDQQSRHLTRAGAISGAREKCKALMGLGVLSELAIKGKAGGIVDRRTYGKDPRRSRG